ncbi:MAG: hypothetical protein NVS3B25_25020 [Hymenobacter sp.]
MIKFDVQDYQLTLTPETLLVPAFKKLVDADRSPNKTTALKDLLYVWGMYDEQSLYGQLPYEDKEKAVRRDAYGSANYAVPADRQKYLDEAVAVYTAYNETSERRLLLVMEKKMQQLTAYLDKMAVDDDEGFKRVMDTMTKLKVIVSAREEAATIVERGIAKGKTRTKGNLERSPRERGQLGKHTKDQ